MNIKVENKVEKRTVRRKKEVVHIECSREEAALILLAMAGYTPCDIDKKHKEWLNKQFVYDDFQKLLRNTKIQSENIAEIFDNILGGIK